jgi:hypothetical protein
MGCEYVEKEEKETAGKKKEIRKWRQKGETETGGKCVS